MFWELIATFSVGLLAAGVVLILRLFLAHWIGRFWVAGAAGLGMLGFQIYGEYSWFQRIRERLPPQSVVVAQFAEPRFYQPWSYWRAPVWRFVVLDEASLKNVGEQQKQALFYFFERRQAAQVWPLRIDCAAGRLSLEIGDSAALLARLCP